MTFLAPVMLWGLALGALPILIHLFNRLRHRKLPWAAMMFLRMANRKSTKYAKIRQWLVLMFRVLVVLALIMALSRPLAGGFIGGMYSSKPDVILVVLDQSTSMGAHGSDGNGTRLGEAVDTMVNNLNSIGQGVRVLVLRHTDRIPHELTYRITELKAQQSKLEETAKTKATKEVTDQLAEVKLRIAALEKGGSEAFRNYVGNEVTDTAADMPSLLEAAVNWFEEVNPGRGEIWIASDLQKSNWDNNASDHWAQISKRINALPQKVGVRLLELNTSVPDNASIHVASVSRVGAGDNARLKLDVELSSATTLGGDVAVDVYINDPSVDANATPVRNFELGEVSGSTHAVSGEFPMPKDADSGWGYVELTNTDDGNPRDNRAYFVYGEPTRTSTTVVGDAEAFTTRFLNLAAAPDPANTNQVSQIIEPIDVNGNTKWAGHQMVIWQGGLPQGLVATNLTAFMEAGGTLVCFAGRGGTGAEPFHGVQWGAVEKAKHDGNEFDTWQDLVGAEEEEQHLGFLANPLPVADGPFRKTEEGLPLPVSDLRINQRRVIEHTNGNVLAGLENEDGAAATLVLRKIVGRGQLIVCGTAPDDGWSSLTEGVVLLPMLQRLLADGEAALTGRYIKGQMLIAGRQTRETGGEPWVSLDDRTGLGKDFHTQAGVYRQGERMVAVNRAPEEDALAALNLNDVQSLFSGIEVEAGRAGDPKEIWEWFLALMALALIVEAILVLPKGTDERVEIRRTEGGKLQTQS